MDTASAMKRLLFVLLVSRIVRNRGNNPLVSIIIGSGLVALWNILRRTYNLISPGEPPLDPKWKNKNGGELVAKVLKAHGVNHVITLSGGHISPILVECENLDIKVVDTRHEATAAFCADGLARLTGKPQVVCVTAGPGLTNVVTAVQNAKMAESPLIIISGAAAILTKDRGALQDIDHQAIMKPMCKITYSISRVKDIIPTLREAFQIAQSDTPGPVYIEIPLDVLYSYSLIESSLGLTKAKSNNWIVQLTQWYLGKHVQRIFADAFQPQETKPLKIYKPALLEHEVLAAANILKEARKPVLLIGSAAMNAQFAKQLQDAVTKLNIPTFLAGAARGLLGQDSPIQLRHVRKQALAQADIIILAGVACDFRLDYGRVLNRRAKIISLGVNRKTLRMNSPTFWKPALAYLVDPCSFLIQLSKVTPLRTDTTFLNALKAQDDAKEEANAKQGQITAPEGRVNPVAALKIIEEALPDCIFIADGGDFIGTSSYIVRPRGPLQWMDPGAFGTLGCGGGFALAAKLLYPEKPVVILFGDGSAGYSMMEFDTYVRNNLGVIAIVGNDSCWTQIAREQVTMFGSDVACKLADTCLYHGIARGCGGDGVEVTGLDEVKPAIEQALTSAADGIPFLVNLKISKSDFRAGSISV